MPGLELAMVEGEPAGDGEYKAAMRYKAGTNAPLHIHPEEMRLVVISGQFFVALGDKPGAERKTLNAGSVVVIPKGAHHSEGAISDAVVLVHGKGPMRIELVNGTSDRQATRSRNSSTPAVRTLIGTRRMNRQRQHRTGARRTGGAIVRSLQRLGVVRIVPDP